MTEHGWGAWDSNWAWSMGLIAVSIAFHAAAVVFVSHASRRFWEAPLRRQLADGHRTAIAVGVIVGVALSLTVAHGVESGFWAVVYLKLGAVGTPAGAMLYSIDSMTTRGSSGFALEARWRMMGAMESLNGMMLFGISTAFLFSVLQRLLIAPPVARAS
jgi:hypothetical protein